MNPLIEFLKTLEEAVFVSQDGLHTEFKLLPPLSVEELAALSSNIPWEIPQDIQELLTFTRGFDGTWLGEVCFAPAARLSGFEELFPHAIELANDGLGNYWILDLVKESHCWGPIFFACHDAPVVVYQTNSLIHFIEEAVREGNKPWRSEISEVLGPLSNLIWRDNPGVLTFSHCVNNSDLEIKTFAESLDETWQFIDLRNPVLGDGFSWGRYGPKTSIKRFGEKRLFAYQKKSLGRRILEAVR